MDQRPSSTLSPYSRLQAGLGSVCVEGKVMGPFSHLVKPMSSDRVHKNDLLPNLSYRLVIFAGRPLPEKKHEMRPTPVVPDIGMSLR